MSKRIEITNEIKALYNGNFKKSSNVSKDHPKLYWKARRVFGTWKRALEASGLDYEETRNNKKWSRERVISEIKKLCMKGDTLRVSKLRASGKTNLVSAASYHFGSWSKAVSTADNGLKKYSN